MAGGACAQGQSGAGVLRHDRGGDFRRRHVQLLPGRSDQSVILVRGDQRPGRGADHDHDDGNGAAEARHGEFRPALAAGFARLDCDRRHDPGRYGDVRDVVSCLPNSGEDGMRSRIAVIACALLAAAPMRALAETDSTSLSLPGEGVTFLPIYTAQDAHFFEKEGLAVKMVYLPGVGTTNAVISGAVDFGISNGVSLTRAAAHGQKMLAIASMSDTPGWTLVMRKDVVDASGIDLKAPLKERMQILKGHSFAIDTVSSLAHAYLRVLEKAGGIDPDSVPISPTQPQDAVAVMERKG